VVDGNNRHTPSALREKLPPTSALRLMTYWTASSKRLAPLASEVITPGTRKNSAKTQRQKLDLNACLQRRLRLLCLSETQTAFISRKKFFICSTSTLS
jgi:hypothetical protein